MLFCNSLANLALLVSKHYNNVACHFYLQLAFPYQVLSALLQVIVGRGISEHMGFCVDLLHECFVLTSTVVVQDCVLPKGV